MGCPGSGCPLLLGEKKLFNLGRISKKVGSRIREVGVRAKENAYPPNSLPRWREKRVPHVLGAHRETAGLPMPHPRWEKAASLCTLQDLGTGNKANCDIQKRTSWHLLLGKNEIIKS